MLSHSFNPSRVTFSVHLKFSVNVIAVIDNISSLFFHYFLPCFSFTVEICLELKTLMLPVNNFFETFINITLSGILENGCL